MLEEQGPLREELLGLPHAGILHGLTVWREEDHKGPSVGSSEDRFPGCWLMWPRFLRTNST